MNLPPEPLRSCPILNWLMLPGEPVRWYELHEYGSTYDESRWVEITEADARRIAGKDKR